MEYIYKYTRQNAIDDGVLRDVSTIADRWGFKVNTCISETLFMKFEESLDELFLVIQETIQNTKNLSTDLLKIKYNNEELVFHIGPDDEGKPCFTICYPEEF